MKKNHLLTLFCCLSFSMTVFCQDAAPAKDSMITTYLAKDTAAAHSKTPLTLKEKDQMARNLLPDEGMALVYVMRPSAFGALIRMAVRFDSVRIGSTKAGNYVYAMVAPGTHTIISSSENDAKLDVTLEAGKVYYIKQQVKMGFAYAETGLILVTAEEGQKYMKKCSLAKDNLATK